jgi:hypothetical protein
MDSLNFQQFISKFYSNTLVENNVSEKIMLLSIFVDSPDKDLKNLYLNAAEKHNKKLIEDPYFYDAGFDLFLPKNEKEEDGGTRFFSNSINKFDFKVKCCAKIYNRKYSCSCNYILHPFNPNYQLYLFFNFTY